MLYQSIGHRSAYGLISTTEENIMANLNVRVCKQADKEFKQLPKEAKKAFNTYVKEILQKGGDNNCLQTEKFKSVHTSVIEVKVKGRPASRMFYTTFIKGHIEVLAFATKSRNDQDPKIKTTLEVRFKAFKRQYGIK